MQGEMNMLKTGLVSVTFRKLMPEEIIALVKEAGLDAIEWGGDVHVPSGDFIQARKVRRLTEEAGLQIASYGSYYKVGIDDHFAEVLETAAELGAPSIRIWAGNRASADADSLWWDRVTEKTKRISDLSGAKGIHLSFEYHNNTLADDLESAVRLMNAVNRAQVHLYWQPQLDLDTAANLNVLTGVSQWLSNIHVFHIVKQQQLALSDGFNEWSQYFQLFPVLPVLPVLEGQRYALLEFVKNEAPEQFIEDAKALKSLVQSYNSE
jgi:3-dehydroshikimate dehydratase